MSVETNTAIQEVHDYFYLNGFNIMINNNNITRTQCLCLFVCLSLTHFQYTVSLHFGTVDDIMGSRMALSRDTLRSGPIADHCYKTNVLQDFRTYQSRVHILKSTGKCSPS